MLTHPPLPIGTADFRKIREAGKLYVDKTALIDQVVADPAEVLLLPRPRRFGKTTNLSTLRYFFERSPEDLSALFADLAVWRSEPARARFQRHPVIYLTPEGPEEDQLRRVPRRPRIFHHPALQRAPEHP